MKKFFLLFLTLIVVDMFAFKVIMVTDVGGLGDGSFMDGTWSGIVKACEELGVEYGVIQSKEQGDYVSNLSKAAEQADVVFAVGFLMSDAFYKVAQQYPETYFVGIDFDSGTILANVMTFTFKEQEGSFLTGYLAAGMTKTGKVAIIGGIPIPPVKRYEIGFRAGVRAYNQIHNANIEVKVVYSNSFTDPKKGKELAQSLIGEGVDIIQQACGGTALGIIEAIKEENYKNVPNGDLKGLLDYMYDNIGYFMLGGDIEQEPQAPGHILASAIKRVDVASYLGVKKAYNGEWQPGNIELGLKEEGEGISRMRYTKGLVPDSLIYEIEYLTGLVKDGKLIIPSTEEELNAMRIKISF
ncbi:membrane protein [Thermosipho melanesiensis]|uniref:Basic membrane lipoprotein n=2 Tax=Thermosipho melanesiensis TaxID=46541 RepID=A6LNG8_THEM4|nr:BMP family ABC transporter substrate-binding protein [Thermosipho melanesiensis]ABR31469.1 basic membrane lipoprotein [Thermosipho melanesiensis BI429]APT74527.1 membrane protein [Thermosipho melanesiensis]OOC36479.1 membrane protein [Thermosipho melanesiensis]OOC37297.1 membrane protein [Thermosipho melanesiensis]OOC38050.1 membrane protein [Thermosipho melanesiensis]